MGDDSWQDENAMKYLHWAMKVPYPLISFITGVGENKVAQKYNFYEGDLGNMFMALFASDYWNPHNCSIGYLDYGRTFIKFGDYKVGVFWGNIAPRFDQKYERIAAYRNSYCVFMLYTALSKQSFEHMKQRIEEAQAICSDLIHIPTPTMIIVGVHYHCPEEDIQVPFSEVQEYASSIGVKAYQTFGPEQAEQARSIVHEVIRMFVDKGLLLKDGGELGFEHTKAVFNGEDPTQLKKKTLRKRSRCIIA